MRTRVLVPVDVISLELMPPEGSYWTDESMYDPKREMPRWRMREAAGFFFARSQQWLHQHIWAEHLRLDGVLLEIPRDEHEHHIWRLCDIERAAHGLLQNGYLQVERFETVIRLVKLVAENYGYLLPSRLETQVLPITNAVRRKAIMASETHTVVVDDLDGSDGASTRRFSIEGVHYRVDLNDKNWEEFLNSISAVRAVASPDKGRRAASPEEAAERSVIRAWAIEQSIDIGARGRIPQEIIDKYHESVGQLP